MAASGIRDRDSPQQLLHTHLALPVRAVTQTQKLLLFLLPPSIPLFVIHTRTYNQTNREKEINPSPPFYKKNAQGVLVLRHCGVYYLTDNQSLEEQSTRTQIYPHTYTHIPHTLLEPDSLIHCCHGNPIKGGHSGCNSGEISLSLSSAPLSHSLFLLHTHTHTLTFLFFHCQPFLFVSLHYFLFLSHCTPALLVSPLAQLPVRLSPLLRYLFIISPPTSQTNVNMASHLTTSSSCL